MRLKFLNRREFGILLGAGLSVFASRQIATASSRSHEIVIRRFRFEPDTLSVKPGDTVVWRNEDRVPHTATASEGKWDTGTIAAGDHASATFEAAGRCDYVCHHHPAMEATIIVEN